MSASANERIIENGFGRALELDDVRGEPSMSACYTSTMRIVVTGANRGIGLEIVRQCAARGDEVFAGARDPDHAHALLALRASVFRCDVADDASVRAFAFAVEGPIDAVINNAGVIGHMASFEEFDLDDALRTFSINALGPARVTRAFLPHLRRGKTKKVLHLSTGMASIQDNTSGGAYAYRMSKAALNMMNRSLAVDLRDQGIVTCVINPGWVKTDMGGKHAETPVEDSVRGILARLDEMKPEDSGQFLDFKAGKRWPF
jgi:NAD(P)-dependent dehydrogenase (short-subunit alcohol dehydrogenase family)